MSPDAVKAAAVRDQLLLVLGGASLSRDEAASLHGKIQNFNSILEGKAGRSLTVAFAEMASGSVSTNDSFVKQSAQYWLEMFEMVPPPWDATGQHLLVFCDNLGILSAAVSGRSQFSM